MADKNSMPEFVYRLAGKSEWDAAKRCGFVPLRDIDEQDGYLHLSTRDQLLETARRHFAGEEDLLALEILLDNIVVNVKFELAPKRGCLFPHLYGRLALQDVVRAVPLLLKNGEFSFGETL